MPRKADADQRGGPFPGAHPGSGNTPTADTIERPSKFTRTDNVLGGEIDSANTQALQETLVRIP